MGQGKLALPVLATVATVGTEKLATNVLQGKKLFYDARDPRLARDSYMSCASCHSDAGHDGRTWDFTGFGEGLRNTPSLSGRGGNSHGFIHWSGNFDEVQDFEAQIRNFAGGTGLMTDAQFNTGTRNTPLGDKKAGISSDLDALAAYLGSLNKFDESPNRNADGTLTTLAVAGKTVFTDAKCASCHGGTNFSVSGDASTLKDIGTIKTTSGKRLGGTLSGIDVPTLRDAWKTGPYLHDGGAPTLAAAVQAHKGNTIAGTDLANLVTYLQQLGKEEQGPGTSTVPAGALAAWDFDAVSGASAPDSAGNNRPLTLSAGMKTTASGLSGSALQGAGPASQAGATTAAKLVDTNGSFSVSGWMRFDQLPECWNQIMASQDGTNVSGFYLGITPPCGGSAEKFQFAMRSADADTSTNYAALSSGTPTVSKWYHLVGIRNSTAGTVTLYVDGALAQTVAAPSANWTANGGFAVGRSRFSGEDRDPVYAAVDAVRVYGRALTAAEVTSLYQVRGTTSAETPLVPSNQAPAVSLTAPAKNASVVEGNAITLTANASDSDGSISKVEFFDGMTALATVTAAPYTYQWTSAAVGNHTLTARATDNSGAATTSASVVLTITAKAPPLINKAPTVRLTTPINNATVRQGTSITITANAADSDGTVSKVEIFDGTTLLATVTAAPYSYKWTKAALGKHTLTARATDNRGATTKSAAIAVTVTSF